MTRNVNADEQEASASRELIPAIDRQYLSVTLVPSSALGPAGRGGTAFQQAIGHWNARNYPACARSFEEALHLGLDPLRQGYAHANLGVIKVKTGDLAGAVKHFLKVLKSDQALYESVHDAAQYMAVVLETMGRTRESASLRGLAARTQAQLGYSLSPSAAEEIRRLVRPEK